MFPFVADYLYVHDVNWFNHLLSQPSIHVTEQNEWFNIVLSVSEMLSLFNDSGIFLTNASIGNQL